MDVFIFQYLTHPFIKLVHEKNTEIKSKTVNGILRINTLHTEKHERNSHYKSDMYQKQITNIYLCLHDHPHSNTFDQSSKIKREEEKLRKSD
jgi:hypothetical protein